MDLIELEKVEILLDNNKTVYHCGNTISGTVNITLNGELDLSIVTIVLRSMSEVKWVEDPGTRYHKEGHVYRDEQQYLHVVYHIPDNILKSKITKGSHNIQFEFILPDDIPSSIDTDYGYISYWIEVIINDDLFACDVSRERKHFTVESPFRENLYLSFGGGTEKGIGFPCLGSGKVRFDASIRKKGHTPGETVEVHCLVANTSTFAVTPRASFYQIQIFMAKERHKTMENLREPVLGEQVNAGETREQTISVQIPKEMPLTIKTRLISVKYFIHVTLDIPHALDLLLNLPIIITNENALTDKSE